MHLGTAFQLVDDVLDYSGTADAIGKNVGDDLAEGKMTLPLIHALANGTAEEAAVIRHAIAGGGRTDFAPVVAALDAHRRAGLFARARADAEVRRAPDVPRGLARFSAPQKFARIDAFASSARSDALRFPGFARIVPSPRGVA